MKRLKLFIIHSISVIICSLFIKVITSIFDVFIANKLGAEALGVYSIILSIYMFCVTLATSGVNLAITKVVSEEAEKNNLEASPKITKICVIYSLSLGILAGILLVIFTPYICNTLLANKISYLVLYVLAISLPFVSVSSALSRLFSCCKENG